MTDHPVRKIKLTTLTDLASRVTDGMTLAVGGFGVYGRPMAFVRELIRLGRKELTVVTTTSGQETELFVGAGLVRRLETAYAGLEKWGLARRVRAAIESGEIEIADYDEVMSFDRFRAAQDGLTAFSANYMHGSSLPEQNPDMKPTTNPLTGAPEHAIPAAEADIAIVHVPAADRYGNAAMPADQMMPQGLDLTTARAFDRVLLTAENIVDTNALKRFPQRVQIPSFRVEAVAHAPWGAHPGPMLGSYDADSEHFDELVEAGTSAELFDAYLSKYVREVPDNDAYLDLVGISALLKIQRRSFK